MENVSSSSSTFYWKPNTTDDVRVTYIQLSADANGPDSESIATAARTSLIKESGADRNLSGQNDQQEPTIDRGNQHQQESVRNRRRSPNSAAGASNIAGVQIQSPPATEENPSATGQAEGARGNVNHQKTSNPHISAERPSNSLPLKQMNSDNHQRPIRPPPGFSQKPSSNSLHQQIEVSIKSTAWNGNDPYSAAENRRRYELTLKIGSSNSINSHALHPQPTASDSSNSQRISGSVPRATASGESSVHPSASTTPSQHWGNGNRGARTNQTAPNQNQNETNPNRRTNQYTNRRGRYNNGRHSHNRNYNGTNFQRRNSSENNQNSQAGCQLVPVEWDSTSTSNTQHIPPCLMAIPRKDLSSTSEHQNHQIVIYAPVGVMNVEQSVALATWNGDSFEQLSTLNNFNINTTHRSSSGGDTGDSDANRDNLADNAEIGRQGNGGGLDFGHVVENGRHEIGVSGVCCDSGNDNYGNCNGDHFYHDYGNGRHVIHQRQCGVQRNWFIYGDCNQIFTNQICWDYWQNNCVFPYYNQTR